MHKIKIGVVGVGHLGSIHARIYKELESCELAGICDINPGRREEISASLGIEGFADYRQLLDKVEAVSVATPTNLHFSVASFFLNHKIHTLVEKPFTTNLKDADRLIDIARRNNLILQVGHIERFNSAFAATQKIIQEPKFIECHRLSPFPRRSLDVGAVLDVMIHDIDIVVGLVGAKIKKIEAVGVNVLTQFEDIANARLTFKNGCVANLTASRVSDEIMRKIRIFQKDTYISLDYKEASACVYRKSGAGIIRESLPIEKEEPLKKELASFINCVAEKKEPLVSGPVGREALAVALEIQKQIWPKGISL
jgi:predicted dehydrogenase